MLRSRSLLDKIKQISWNWTSYLIQWTWFEFSTNISAIKNHVDVILNKLKQAGTGFTCLFIFSFLNWIWYLHDTCDWVTKLHFIHLHFLNSISKIFSIFSCSRLWRNIRHWGKSYYPKWIVFYHIHEESGVTTRDIFIHRIKHMQYIHNKLNGCLVAFENLCMIVRLFNPVVALFSRSLPNVLLIYQTRFPILQMRSVMLYSHSWGRGKPFDLLTKLQSAAINNQSVAPAQTKRKLKVRQTEGKCWNLEN